MSSQYKKIQKRKVLHVITDENYQLEINKINLAIVSFLEDENLSSLEDFQNQETKEKKKREKI